ncbi:MAG TPA: hypothetical protein VID19_11105 [Candidatus Eremiobacteraceae bacterium]
MQDAPGQTSLDQTKVQNFMLRRKDEQSMPLALAAGVVAALVGAAIWAIVTDMTGGIQIGYMAIGVGFLVGYAVRFLGKGIERPYQYVGATCALLGCLLGNYFAMVGFAAQQLHADFFTVISHIPLDKALSVMQESFSPIDLLFYAIAVYAGYRFSLKRITPEELTALR